MEVFGKENVVYLLAESTNVLNGRCYYLRLGASSLYRGGLYCVMPWCACASEVNGSVFVCVCVSVCLSV